MRTLEENAMPNFVSGSVRKIPRNDSAALEDLPNVGRAIATDLRAVGIRAPRDFKGRVRSRATTR